MKLLDWQFIKNITPSDFNYPEALEFSIVQALDKFIDIIGSKPMVLSDYRPYDPKKPTSRHARGKAIDTTWPGADPIVVWDKALESGLFGGLGIYVNPDKAVSFHFDSRDKKADGSVYKWGGIITRPAGQKKIEYTGASVVLKMIPTGGIVVVLLIAGYVIWQILKK